MSDIQEILMPEGRIVAGHPMVAQTKTDNRNQPVKNDDGTNAVEYYFGFAVPKGQEQDWKATQWGQQIQQAAQAGWPNGEFNSPTFSWKVTDGDSQVPNQRGKKPADREGWPGHWVLHLKTMMPIRCYHVGKYDPMQQIQDRNEIKPGDYGRVFLSAKANNPSQSPGVYLNPQMFELCRAGQQIILDSGPDAASVFGGGQPAPQQSAPTPPTQAPQAGQPAPQPQVQVQVQPPAQPHTQFLNGPAPQPQPQAEPMYEVGGNRYTYSQLQGFGWTDAQIAQSATPVAQ